MIRLSLVFLTVMTGCAPSDRLIRIYAHQTDVWQTISHDTEVFRDGKDHISARTIILEHGGETRHYLSLSVLRSGPNEPQILRVTQDGHTLAYTLQIDGLRRQYTARVPARLFWYALDAADQLDPTTPR